MPPSPPFVLHTPRLLLTLPGAEGAERMVHYFASNREHLQPWEPLFSRSLFTHAFWRNQLPQNQRDQRAGESLRLVLLDREDFDGPIVGLVNFTRFVRGVSMSCQLGYSLDQDRQGRGLMQEALTSAITYLFQEQGMHRIVANYIPRNERSGQLLKRLDFQPEGYARDFLYIDGAWRDHVLTAKTNPNAPLPDHIRTQENP